MAKTAHRKQAQFGQKIEDDGSRWVVIDSQRKRRVYLGPGTAFRADAEALAASLAIDAQVVEINECDLYGVWQGPAEQAEAPDGELAEAA
jgi:hypothetical protein